VCSLFKGLTAEIFFGRRRRVKDWWRANATHRIVGDGATEKLAFPDIRIGVQPFQTVRK
jgi:hypothetical protein